MSNIILRPSWQGRTRDITPEELYRNRREFLKSMGFLGMAGLLASALPACAGEDEATSSTVTNKTLPADAYNSPQPALPATVSRNERFTVPERPVTPYKDASSYNNFYEFYNDKDELVPLAQKLTTDPWSVEIAGLVRKPGSIPVENLLTKYPLEERIYRHRCVEAWAMTVPWVGFPLHKLIAAVEPLPEAKYVRFVTLLRPEEMPAQSTDDWYPWPYYEGLRMDEAMNELTLVTVGLYGKTLPKQNGAPIRIVTPWKYGYKSIKSIVRIEFLDKQPPTFWNDLQPAEYGFYSNVNPGRPHPRWSQATERLLTGGRVDTRIYNGYGEFVAGMYTNEA